MTNSKFSTLKESLFNLGIDIELSDTQILNKSIDLILRYLQTIEEIPRNFQEELNLLLPSLQPEMSNFALLNEILNEITEPLTKLNLYSSLTKLKEDIKDNEKKSIELLLEEMKSKKIENIITISYSKLVFDSIIRYNEEFKVKTIIISASSPKYEGVKLANDLRLKMSKIDLILVDDPRMANYLHKYQKGSIILLGCDSIFQDGSVLNKSGSLSLAIISKHFKIPCYVIGTRFKKRKIKYSSGMIRNQELHELPWYSKELKDNNMQIENKLFDYIPKDLIAKIFF